MISHELLHKGESIESIQPESAKMMQPNSI